MIRIIFLALVAATISGIAMSQSQSTGEDILEFDRDIWMSANWKDEESDIRAPYLPAALKMIEPGMSRDKVEDLLGPPEIVFDSSIVYMINTTIFGGEYDVLIVRLDDKNTVERAWKGSSEGWQ